MVSLDDMDSKELGQRLLRIARMAAGEMLGLPDAAPATQADDRPASETPKDDAPAGGAPKGDAPLEGRCGGAFVTFWAGKRLRGCMGTFAATTDIDKTVREVTRSSLRDPRFEASPVTAAELGALVVEVSLLSDPEPTTDPLSLVPGKHGIVVRRGVLSGCFLPKVASDRDWSAEEFLSNCCTTKAGLPADAWQHPDTEVLLFTAAVFSEVDPGT